MNPDFALDVPYGLHVALDIEGIAPIESVASPSHHVVVDFATSTVHVEFVAETAKMDRDFVLDVTYREGSGSRGFVAALGDETFAQVDLSFPETDGTTPAQEREVVFVVDCSGSMDGTSIAQAKRALAILLRSLPEGVRFNVVRFGSSFEGLFTGAEPYTPESAQKALAVVEAMEADLGGTEMLGPLEFAMQRPPVSAARRDIILITDGEISDEEAVIGLAERKRERNRVFTVAIGYGPNEYFVRQVARTSGGLCVMVAPGERIEPAALRLFKRVVSTPITDLRIEWPGSSVQAPYAPVVHVGETTSVFARMPGDGQALEAGLSANVSARVAEEEVTFRVPLEEVSASAAPVPQLWAREAIRDLEAGADERSRRGSRQDRASRGVPARVTSLSRCYGVIASSTSFVAIETREGADRTREESVLRRVPVMLTKDWHGLGRFQGVAAGAPRAVGFAAGPASMRQSIMAAPGVSGRGFPVPTMLSVRRPDLAAGSASMRQSMMAAPGVSGGGFPGAEDAQRPASGRRSRHGRLAGSQRAGAPRAHSGPRAGSTSPPSWPSSPLFRWTCCRMPRASWSQPARPAPRRLSPRRSCSPRCAAGSPPRPPCGSGWCARARAGWPASLGRRPSWWEGSRSRRGRAA